MECTDYDIERLPSESLIEKIKTNENAILNEVYRQNYFKVENYILKNNGNEEDAKDVFQEALVSVWTKIKLNHLVPESFDSINGYLYMVAKHKWIDYLRSKNYKMKKKSIEIKESLLQITDKEYQDDSQIVRAETAFEMLGEACKSLLLKFYYERKNLAEIALELNLNTNSIKTKKYRCMQNLRKLTANI